MKKFWIPIACCLTIALSMGQPLAAQSWFFPDFALPSAGDQATKWLGATYGRGLNENSGEADAFGISLGTAEGRFSFSASLGYISEDPGDYTAGASIGVDLNTGPGPRFSIQGGVGWIDFDFFDDTVTFLRFPIGLALKQRIEGESATVIPWVMPRLNLVRASGGGESETESDFGASGGVSITMTSGLGFHAALDGLFHEGESAWELGLGLHYVLGR